MVESEGEVVDLTRENRRLEDRVQELEKTLAIQKAMTFKAPLWYQEGDQTPFCPACWEKDKIAVHVAFAFDRHDATRWDCPCCKYMFIVKKANAPSDPPRHRIAGGPNSWMG
jgi:hypothetical protein